MKVEKKIDLKGLIQYPLAGFWPKKILVFILILIGLFLNQILQDLNVPHHYTDCVGIQMTNERGMKTYQISNNFFNFLKLNIHIFLSIYIYGLLVQIKRKTIVKSYPNIHTILIAAVIVVYLFFFYYFSRLYLYLLLLFNILDKKKWIL